MFATHLHDGVPAHVQGLTVDHQWLAAEAGEAVAVAVWQQQHVGVAEGGVGRHVR